MLDSKSLIAALPTSPGIYRMLNEGRDVLYVGKARNLRKRVASYFRKTGLDPKVVTLMQNVAAVEITVTHTENEALLLENNLIKSLQPQYNILLRDDKGYPYIFVADTQEFPRIGFHRGAKREKGRYFGPYPSASAVRESLGLMQKIFLVRQCEDSFFRNRSRPCLQYQIQRCSGPCVGLIDAQRYREDVQHAILFLEGRSQKVIAELVSRMEQASERLDYETAALCRDRIATLKPIQEKQYIMGDSGDADVVACVAHQNAACIEVTFIRNGANLGSRAFYPRVGTNASPEDVLAAFLPQYYLGKTIPPRIYLNRLVSEIGVLAAVFTEQSGRKVTVARPGRGAPKRWVRMAEINAVDQLRRWLASRLSLAGRFEALRDVFEFDALPDRIECFDISHTQGEATVASCVVFDRNGPVKSDYRRFNIEDVEPGDDYGAISQALTRRYRRVKEGEGRLPDLLLIDGGKGQLRAAEAVMQELQIEEVRLVGVAKGPERKPGKEQLFLSGQPGATILPANSAALHLIQQVRDEAHRFAITGHRQRRAKARTTSRLESIPGIGDRRRQALLKNFGGLREVARAGVEDLAKTPGINRELAQRIYDVFHEQEH
jgi:excinuclease ABC subunit C